MSVFPAAYSVWRFQYLPDRQYIVVQAGYSSLSGQNRIEKFSLSIRTTDFLLPSRKDFFSFLKQSVSVQLY